VYESYWAVIVVRNPIIGLGLSAFNYRIIHIRRISLTPYPNPHPHTIGCGLSTFAWISNSLLHIHIIWIRIGSDAEIIQTTFIPTNDHYFPMLSPSTRGMLLQTKSASSGSFVVSLQARNQFSKPSTEMELVHWPRVARSMTCEQDRPASKIDVCVIWHISSWRYGSIVTLFWCINDDCNLCVCVWFCISSHEHMSTL
jgi:hypothetical protein